MLGSTAEKWSARPRYNSDDMIRFFEMPPLRFHPVELVRFFRKVKKCMVLYWVSEASTMEKLPHPHALALQAIRILIKKPGGPAIVVEDASGNTPLRSIADIVVNEPSEYLNALKEGYFAAECGHPSSIYREPMQKERIEWLKKSRTGSLLEIGCSTGFVLNHVGGGVGVDVDALRLEYARRRFPKNQFVQTDASQMPFEEDQFDTVMIPDILEHVEPEHAQKIINEAKRVGKKLLITVPNAGKANYDKDLVENPEHRWFPTEPMVQAMVGPKAQVELSPGQDFIYVTFRKESTQP